MTKAQAQLLLRKHYHAYRENSSFGSATHDLKVKEDVRALNHHPQIKRAYVSTTGNLIVLTNRIYPVDPADHHRYPQIGRFTIRIRYGASHGTDDGISIANRDYHSTSGYSAFDEQHFEHPHVRTFETPYVCFGDNQAAAEGAYDNGDLYGLIDFILLFLSTWNAENGEPYVQYGEFYELRTARHSNLFKEKEAV